MRRTRRTGRTRSLSRARGRIHQALALKPALQDGALGGALDQLERLERLVVVADLDADVDELDPEGVACLSLVQGTMKDRVASFRRVLDVRLRMMMSSQHWFSLSRLFRRTPSPLMGRCR
jgi:hypothetical protein